MYVRIILKFGSFERDLSTNSGTHWGIPVHIAAYIATSRDGYILE